MTLDVRFFVKRILNENTLNIMTSIFGLIGKLFPKQDRYIPEQSAGLARSIGVAKDAHVNLVVIAVGDAGAGFFGCFASRGLSCRLIEK